jgi:hypothetical protein
LPRSPADTLEILTDQVANDVLTSEQFRAAIAELKLPYDLSRIRETVYGGEFRPYTKTTEPDERDSALPTVPVPDDLVQAFVDHRGPKQREVYELLQRRTKRENSGRKLSTAGP